MARVRVTNNSELELNDITGVWFSGDTVRITLKDGSAKQIRLVQLTPEARRGFWEMSKFLGRPE